MEAKAIDYKVLEFCDGVNFFERIKYLMSSFFIIETCISVNASVSCVS